MYYLIRLAELGARVAGYRYAKKNLTLLLDGEQVIRQASIGWQENKIFTDDGMLQLTNLRLRFLSGGRVYISYFLKDVVSVTFRNWRFVLPMGILVGYSDGRQELFGVMKREQWANAILTAKANAGPVGETERASDGSVLDADDVAIRQRLSRHFSQDEIKTLCFDLGVDYDDLAGISKDEKARELVVRLDRDGKLPQLLKRGKELRPKVVWY